MKEIELTQGYKALVDDEDFERVSQFRWHAVVEKSKGKNKRLRSVYAQRALPRENGKQHKERMHRFILGVGAVVEVDHKDSDGLNNQKDNIRKATDEQNAQNMRKQENKTSRFKGVYWYKLRNCWRAKIRVKGVLKSLGYYKEERNGALAYDEAARKFFGEFALTNF